MQSIMKRYLRPALPLLFAIPLMAATCDGDSVECRTCGLPPDQIVVVRTNGESRQSHTDASGCITTECGAQISTPGGTVVTAEPPVS